MKQLKFILIATITILIGLWNVQAESLNSIDTPFSIHKEGIYFESLKFDAYSYGNDEQIGFMGKVENKNSDTITLNLKINFYDSQKNLIVTDNKDFTISGQTEVYYNLHSLAKDLKTDSKNIYYYDISFEIKSGIVDYEESVENNKTNSNQNSNYISNSKNYSYVIESYDVNMKVNENNTIDIIETITADFNTPKHGIIRTIPLKNEVKRLDGTTTKNRTQITNVNVDHEYKEKKENGNYKIQIGSANQTITGKQTYVIRYTYNLGKDPMKEYDELYYNIIGSQWDTSITNITFTITMPKEFDSSKLGFSSGVVGSVNNNVQYKVSENKITGSYDGTLAPNEALTVRLELPEGYFVGAGLTFQIKDYLVFIAPVLFLIISILLWYKFGKDDPVVETVEFYPPAGFNSLEIGYLYKGKADYQDVTSLLIYLFSK